MKTSRHTQNAVTPSGVLRLRSVTPPQTSVTPHARRTRSTVLGHRDADGGTAQAANQRCKPRGELRASCADNRILIAKAGGIPPLVALVRDGTDAQKADATAALRSLALNDDNEVLIAKAKREAGVASEFCSLL